MGRGGGGSLLIGPGSELRLGREKEKEKREDNRRDEQEKKSVLKNVGAVQKGADGGRETKREITQY